MEDTQDIITNEPALPTFADSAELSRSESKEVTKPSSPRGLKRYVEWITRGRRTGRTAYVLREWDLPAPLSGAEWAVDTKFHAAEELLKDPKLKATIAAVLKNGVEIVGAIEVKVKQKPSVGLPDETRISDVDLPRRIQHVLTSNGIRTVGELRKTGDDTLLRFQNLGRRSLAFIREHLRGR